MLVSGSVFPIEHGEYSRQRAVSLQEGFMSKVPWFNVDGFTLHETNIAPENWGLEDYFHFKMPSFQGLC